MKTNRITKQAIAQRMILRMQQEQIVHRKQTVQTAKRIARAVQVMLTAIAINKQVCNDVDMEEWVAAIGYPFFEHWEIAVI